jgi:hypothetical protein
MYLSSQPVSREQAGRRNLNMNQDYKDERNSRRPVGIMFRIPTLCKHSALQEYLEKDEYSIFISDDRLACR